MFRQKRRNPNDKIFDSTLKQGTIDYQIHNTKIEVNKNYESRFLESQKNCFDHYQETNLYERLLEIWFETKWSKVYKDKRHIPKDRLSEIYDEIKSTFQESLYSNAEIFCAISEFLNVSYTILYEMISTKYKEEILKDVKKKYPNHFKEESYCLF
jgi:hypothetical protein